MTKERFTFGVALLAVTITVILLILSVTYIDIPLYQAMFIGYSITFIIALIFYNKNIKKLILASFTGIRSISTIFFIMLLIGVLIAIWSSSGTIDALVFYGLGMINPNYLVVISFIASLLVSLLLGTSVGTASTIGVAFMGMANSLDINSALVAGAIVSGAFVGDRTSPLSSSAHVNTVVTETKYYDNIKGLIKTITPVIAITALIYFLIGVSYNDNVSNSVDIVNQSKEQILFYFNNNINLLLLLPPAFIMVLAFFKVPIKLNLLIGSLIGLVLAYIFQGGSLIEILNYAIFGFQHPKGVIYGGAWNMFNQVLLIIVAGAYYGLLEFSGIIDILLKKMTDNLNDSVSLVKNTMIISTLSAILSSTQIMGIMIPGKVMIKHYKRLNIDLKILNRSISDSGMVISGLIPWNLNAILLGITLHIPVIDYLPYAFLLMILPLYSYWYQRRILLREEKVSGRNYAKNQE